MPNNDVNNPQDRYELIQVLKMTVDDIARTKERMWKEFYYSVIAQGGLFAMRGNFPSEEPWFLGGLILGLGVTGVGLIVRSMVEHSNFRRRKEDCIKRLAGLVEAVWGPPDRSHFRAWFYMAALAVVTYVWLKLLKFCFG